MGRNRIARESTLSKHECRAIRALDEADDYGVSEIAFMFECGVDTVNRHAGGDCRHWDNITWSPAECAKAYRLTEQRCEVQQMSPGAYDDLRDDDWPSADTIRRKIGGGSWPRVRERLSGDGEPVPATRERAMTSVIGWVLLFWGLALFFAVGFGVVAAL